jgi:hypothetical protein
MGPFAEKPQHAPGILLVKALSPTLVAILIIGLSFVTASIAAAQFHSIPIKASPRDAAFAEQHNGLYLAVYDRNEVWRIDRGSSETAQRVEVGRGPIALAVASDGNTLAVLNRLSKNVTLLRLPGLETKATVDCEEGAAALAALPGGGFAVANSFADSVTLIDEQAGAVTATLNNVAKVPNAIAATDNTLAVATRVPTALRIYRAGSQEPSSILSLPSAAVAMTSIEGDILAVLTEDELLFVDGGRGGVQKRLDVTGVAMTAQGGRVYVVTGSDVRTYTAEGLENSMALSGAGHGIAVQDSTVVVVSPREKQWQISGGPAPAAASEFPPEAASATPPPSVEPRDLLDEPVVVEAETSSQSTADEIEEGAPVLEPDDAAAPPLVVEPELVEPPPIATSTAPPLEPIESVNPKQSTYRRASLGDHRPSIKPLSNRPDAVPTLGAQDGASVTETLGDNTAFTAPLDAFKDINWSTLDQVNYEVLEISPDLDTFTFSDVDVEVDGANLRSDRFVLKRADETARATGNVEIDKALSIMTADEVYYFFGDAQTVEVSEDEDEESRATGRIRATNVHVEEPGRILDASLMDYNFSDSTGLVEDATGQNEALYFGAQKLILLGPASFDGEDIWVTTCDHSPPHYRVRLKAASLKEGAPASGTHARLQFGKLNTPAYWPKWSFNPNRKSRSPISVDFDSGSRPKTGYFVNVGQQFEINPELDAGGRLYITEDEGVGFGIDSFWDTAEREDGIFKKSTGSVRSLYTTEDRGHLEAYHKQQVTPNTTLRLQWEQWSDPDFVKDFYYEDYRNRTEPRAFANLTHTKPGYIATATVRKRTNGFTAETERLPEVTYHLLERQLFDHVYFSFDTINGYNKRRPGEVEAARTVNVARLTYDLDIKQAVSITPFVEADAAWYSHDSLGESDPHGRLGVTMGATAQTRLHRAYGGTKTFSGFKHISIPSITYTYRPEDSDALMETPRFDSLDSTAGRSRIETKWDNIVFARDAESGETWQIARLTLYQGNDFWNEDRRSEDYEMELDIRPRPWWGMQVAAERHETGDREDLNEPFFFRRRFLESYERVTGEPFSDELSFRYNAQFGDYNRVLSYLYYDDSAFDGDFNARIGFAYTETLDNVFNREILYGAGYRVSDKWGFAFEHRYDFERDELARQTYELRRRLHCWEAAVILTDRQEGIDFGLQFYLADFPSTKIKF